MTRQRLLRGSFGALGALAAATQVYFVREWLAALILLALICSVIFGAVFVLVALHEAGVRAMDWMEERLRSSARHAAPANAVHEARGQ